MNLILFCVFLTFSVGLFLLLAGLLRLPTLKTSRVMMDTGKEGKQLSKTLDAFYMDGAVKIARYIRMNDYKKNRMASVLRASGLGMTPEVYTAYAYLKAGSVFLLIIPALYVFPLAALFVILLGIMIYYKEIQKADEILKEKREQIEEELYRFVSTITQELKNSRDVLAMLEHYKENAGAAFRKELDIVCADMRSSSYEAALTRFEARLFCTRWNGIDKASGVIDALDDEEYTGSLILLLEEGMNFARRNSKKMWKKESDRRVEYPEYPERSIFEGLVNGLVHRDYLDMGSEVHIDIFDDRLEIYSPGGMYDGTLIQDRDIDNVPSKRRNPVVADIFSRLDYMERRGSGFKKIMQAYEVEPNYTEDKKPVFYSNATEFRVILKNLNFTDEVLNEKNEVLDEVLNEVLDSGRTEMEIKVIKAILSSPRIKQKELAEQVGISVSTIQRTIKKLVKEGKIVRVNGKRDGYWKVL